MRRNKNKYIIIGLCAVLILMVVGFAVFSQRLEIGDSAITSSDWNVYIKSAVAETPVGKATGSAQVVDRASAKLTANLSSPGDSVTYTITVANDGNIDAVLDLITLSASNSDSVIKYSYAGIEEDEELLAESEKSFTVTIEYDSAKTGTATAEQKQNTLTLDLDYVQANGNYDGSEPVGEAYALLLDNSANSQTDVMPLVFVRSTEEFNVGDSYNNMIIEDVYSDIETTNYRFDDDTSAIYPEWNSEPITSVNIIDEIFPISCSQWFRMLINLQTDTIDLSNLNTTNVTDMSYMFESFDISTLDLSGFDTTNVTDMSYMFANSNISTLNLSGFDTSNVINMSSMFEDSNTSILDLSDFNTSNVTNMSSMFYDANLTEIVLGNYFSFKGACTDSSQYAKLPDDVCTNWRSVETNEAASAVDIQNEYPSTRFPAGRYVKNNLVC